MASQAEHETGAQWVPADVFLGPGSLRWRAPHPAYGARPVTLICRVLDGFDSGNNGYDLGRTVLIFSWIYEFRRRVSGEIQQGSASAGPESRERE
jgi:hypothetical protein